MTADLEPIGRARTGSSWAASPRWRDVLVPAALVVVAVLLPILAGAATGTFVVPRNDDWSYRGIAQRLYETGRLELDGAAQTIVVGQILITQPFLWLSRGGAAAFLVVGVLASGLSIAAGFALLRRFLDRSSAALAILALVLFPGYLAYSTSFMSDVPALASQLGCLWLASIALSRRPTEGRWLAASLLVGCLGFTIREFALAAPAAVVIVVLLRDPRGARSWLIAVAVAVAVLAILAWRSALGGQLGNVPWSIGPLWQLLKPIVSLGLALGPVALLAAWRWRASLSRRGVLIGSLAGELVVVAASIHGPFPSVTVFGLLTPWGAPHPYSLMGDRPTLFPEPFWSAIAVLALLSTILLCSLVGGIAGAHLRTAHGRVDLLRAKLTTTPGLLAVFVAVVAVGLAGFSLVGSFYDRYLWPAVPALAAVLLYVPAGLAGGRAGASGAAAGAASGPAVAGRTPAIVGAGSVVIVGLVAGIVMLNSYAYDGARWRAGEALVALGYRPETVDAGAEWVHAHQTGLAAVTRPVEARMWYQRQWPDLRICAFVADSDPGFPGEFLIGIEPAAYQLNLIVGPAEPMYLYGVTSPGCP